MPDVRINGREIVVLNGFVLAKPLPAGETAAGLAPPVLSPPELARAQVVAAARETDVHCSDVIYFRMGTCVTVAVDGGLYLLLKGESIVFRLAGGSSWPCLENEEKVHA